MSRTILVVDDEPRIVELARDYLEHAGFRVITANDGRAALDVTRHDRPDLIVLDLGLPGLDGLDVTRELRRDGSLPIVMLTARDDELDKLLGLELGADDYLTKPFSPRELVARVRAVFRRVDEPPPPPTTAETRGPVIEHRGIEVDAERHEVRFEGRVVSLTPTEFGVLGALLERPGVVLSRGQLMQRAYRYDNLITERTIDTHVRRIRAKFREAGGDPIATVHGVGYKAAGA